VTNGQLRQIEEQISNSLSEKIKFTHHHSVGGGCINQAWKVESLDKAWFIKTNHANLLEMFAAEYQGLLEIEQSKTIRTPEPILYGLAENSSFLVLEYIHFTGQNNQRTAGKQLAALHQTYSTYFGWHQDNFIGSSQQSNQQHTHWLDFYKQERLLFQLSLALKNGIGSKTYTAGLQLAEALPVFFSTYHPKASLLHGDLWGGNIAYADGEPIIFDPAVYYGDRETDLAMTELFGGFNTDFYASYNDHLPLDPGYQTRKTLYNLYHILNHFNLFGSGYARQADSMIQRLLAET
jgi:protein-ribulosamine 3-kinase